MSALMFQQSLRYLQPTLLLTGQPTASPCAQQASQEHPQTISSLNRPRLSCSGPDRLADAPMPETHMYIMLICLPADGLGLAHKTSHTTLSPEGLGGGGRGGSLKP